MRDRFIAAIDLGSSAIRLAVGQVTVGSDRREVLSMIGADEVISSGISKGAVQSLDDVTSAVSAVLDKVERSIGIPVTEVYVGVGGSQIQVKPTRGVVGISNPDGIREEDYRRVLEHAAQSSHSANYEVLHRLPQRFSIDGQQAIKDPVGMQGARLEAEVCVIQGLVGHVRNITQSVMRTNVDVTGLVFSPLATAEAYLTPRQRDLGSALVNIGATTTSLAVFEDGTCFTPLFSLSVQTTSLATLHSDCKPRLKWLSNANGTMFMAFLKICRKPRRSIFKSSVRQNPNLLIRVIFLTLR